MAFVRSAGPRSAPAACEQRNNRARSGAVALPQAVAAAACKQQRASLPRSGAVALPRAVAAAAQLRSSSPVTSTRPRRAGGAAPPPPRAAATVSSSDAATIASAEVEALRPVTLRSARTAQAVSAASLLAPAGSSRTLLLLLTQFGDFDSFELAQKIVDYLPALTRAGVAVVAVGVGSVEAARVFADETRFPLDKLYADDAAAAHAALGCEPGCGRAGGALPFLAGVPGISGFVKLLLMCAGVGSPGTLPEVFRGYLGDAGAPPVFAEGSNVDLPWRSAFDLVGRGYQRPFELATLRASNMATVLGRWGALAPEDPDLLVQRGGTFLFGADGRLLWCHRDAGILGYAKPGRVAARALAADPSRVEDPAAVLRAAATPGGGAAPEDVHEAMRTFEKVPPAKRGFGLADLNGQWRLRFTTGNPKSALKGPGRAPGGAYFPITAIQSFNAATGHIRNGVYLGPLSLTFDGAFIFDDTLKVLEFQFDRITVALAGRAWSKALGADAWSKLKGAEQAASAGQGRVEKAAPGGRKANPFFKFVAAQDGFIAARGRGGGLALWSRHADAPVEVE